MYTENKQLKDKLDYGLCRASTLGKTQSYFLKFSSASPAVAPFAFSITAKPEQDVLVQQLLVTADKIALDWKLPLLCRRSPFQTPQNQNKMYWYNNY